MYMYMYMYKFYLSNLEGLSLALLSLSYFKSPEENKKFINRV